MTARDLLLREPSHRRREILYIISYALCCPKEKILLELDREFRAEELDRVEHALKERGESRPLAYIRGWAEFFGERFYVNGATFIPRPETELLVEEALKFLEGRRGRRWVLDLGAGCGALGIVVSKRTGARVVLSDISEDALLVAKENVRAHGLDAYIVCCDLVTAFKPEPIFDLVLANLPYIRSMDLERLPPEVRLYEPRIALDGGDSGLKLYERLIISVGLHLKGDGAVLFEVGGRRQAKRLASLLERRHFVTEIRKDLALRERLVVGWKGLS